MIYDFTGKLIENKYLDKINNFNYNLNQVAGIYFIEIKDTKFSKVYKVLKN